MSYKVKMNKLSDKLVMDRLQKRMQTYAADIEVNMKVVMKRQPYPSAPGQPPRIDTGNLIRSITSEMKRKPNKITMRIGTNVDYGRYLELGTEKMKPRPWIRQALRKTHRRYN